MTEESVLVIDSDVKLPTGPKFVNLTGIAVSKLTVISYAGKRGRYSTWNCLCQCGSLVVRRASNLISPRRKVSSCGCIKKHGMCSYPEYKTWVGMRDRCNNKNSKHYKRYGGRGIIVCNRWNTSFSNFYKDMGNRPEGLSLDRRDNDKGYSKDNCRWATPKQQANNRRPPVRKRVLTPRHIERIMKRKNNGEPVVEIAKAYPQVGANTVYRAARGELC